jgi:hypothetical protein
LRLLVAWALGFVALAPSPSLALPSLPQIAATHAHCLVRVHREDGVSATGFFVGSQGVVLTVLGGSAQSSAATRLVVELSNGERRRARIVAEDPGSAAMLVHLQKKPEDEAFCALPIVLDVKGRRPLEKERWLVGLPLSPEGQIQPSLGGVRQGEKRGRLQLDLPAGPGTPVLNEAGEVVLVAEKWVGNHRCRALRTTALLALFNQAKSQLADDPAPKSSGKIQSRNAVQSSPSVPDTGSAP